MMFVRGVFDDQLKTIVLRDATVWKNNIHIDDQNLHNQGINIFQDAPEFCQKIYVADAKKIIVDCLYMSDSEYVPQNRVYRGINLKRRYLLYTGAEVGGHVFYLARIQYTEDNDFRKIREHLYSLRDHFIGEGREDFLEAYFALKNL